MIIDEVLPTFEYRVDVHVVVDASPATTFAAIDTANLLDDPIVRMLSEVRDVPNRVARRMRGDAMANPKRFTFADNASTGAWVDLGETPGLERVTGAVGRFWQRDYGWVPVTPGEFRTFSEPGYAKTVVAFSVRPYGEHRTLLSMDSRTGVTDDEARRRFGRYWLLVRPFARVMMRHGLQCVKSEAEVLAHHTRPEAEVVLSPPNGLVRTGAGS